jgi:predicted PurR-regulated permease PerM
VERLRSAAGNVAGNVVGWLGQILSGLWSGGLAVFNALSLVVIMPVVAFYLLRDWDRIVAHIDGLLPRDGADTIREQVREIDDRLSGFVRGQASVCLALGTWYAVGLTLVGLDFGLLVGIGAGLISFVPYLGTGLGLIVGLGLAVAQYDTWLPIGLVAAVFVSGQMLEGYVLTPRMVGERVGLHPVWVLFALMAGGALLGFTGVLLAVPAAAVIGVLVRFAISRYLQSPLYRSKAEVSADAGSGRSADTVEARSSGE